LLVALLVLPEISADCDVFWLPVVARLVLITVLLLVARLVLPEMFVLLLVA
jgi:hypothetical protein